MSTSESRRGPRIECPWCGEARASGRTVTVGPPPQLGEAHAFELHVECVEEWRAFVDRARRLASVGAKQPLRTQSLESGVDGLVVDD